MSKKPESGISPEDAELFKAAVAKVQPLPHEARAAAPRARAKRAPVQSSERPAQGLFREEGELFYRADLAKERLKELQRGRFRPSATIDLHGQTVAQAEHALLQFLNAHTDFTFRCLLVITGKGSHSPEGYSPVRIAALDLLHAQSWVQAYCWAQPEDGGTGAFYVLTRKLRS